MFGSSWAYSLGQWHAAESGTHLANLLMADHDQPYIVSAALTSLHGENVLTTYEGVRSHVEVGPEFVAVLCEVIPVIAASKSPQPIETVAKDLLPSDSDKLAAWKKQPILTLIGAMRRSGANPRELFSEKSLARLATFLDNARVTLVAQNADIADTSFAANLLAQSKEFAADDVALLICIIGTTEFPAKAEGGTRSIGDEWFAIVRF